MPPQHVLEMAWQEVRQAAEACMPPDGDSHVEPRQQAMQHCNDTSCWQVGPAGGQAAAGSASDACAAAESCDVTAGDQCRDSCSECRSASAGHATEDDEWHFQEGQLVQCEPDSSADHADFYNVNADGESEDITELKRPSAGVAFLFLLLLGCGVFTILHEHAVCRVGAILPACQTCDFIRPVQFAPFVGR